VPRALTRCEVREQGWSRGEHEGSRVSVSTRVLEARLKMRVRASVSVRVLMRVRVRVWVSMSMSEWVGLRRGLRVRVRQG
tara:strand:- start:3 stop:242 length:240 start_codon:yes stop_codon:yes gene_type:complete